MVWLQIVAFSVIAGTVLHHIGQKGRAQRRHGLYLAFVICFSIALIAAFGLQARIDTTHPITGFVIPALAVSAMVCAAALLVSAGIRKYTNVTRLASYLPVFVLALWVICFIALTVATAVYPGS